MFTCRLDALRKDHETFLDEMQSKSGNLMANVDHSMRGSKVDIYTNWIKCLISFPIYNYSNVSRVWQTCWNRITKLYLRDRSNDSIFLRMKSKLWTNVWRPQNLRYNWSIYGNLKWLSDFLHRFYFSKLLSFHTSAVETINEMEVDVNGHFEKEATNRAKFTELTKARFNEQEEEFTLFNSKFNELNEVRRPNYHYQLWILV